LLLRRLAALGKCIVISGRSRAELRGLVDDAGIALLIGNHGAEPWAGAPRLRRQVAAWARALAGSLPPIPGLWIENKKLSLTVHYRQCRDRAGTHAAILAAARALEGARIVEGKRAVGLVSPAAPHKGDALAAAMARMKCPRAVYAGDEDTDEDAFALACTGTVFGIRVGRRKRSRAEYFLRGQAEIDALLGVLIEVAGKR
ncbi:MAG: trehalose-phosphatase, partial [Acidobacteria bacterium]|nr:trehalose-phosphatase [Acidobacteriota bacterium]